MACSQSQTNICPKRSSHNKQMRKEKNEFQSKNIEYFTVSEVNDKLPANPQANKICIRLFGGM